MPRYTAEDNLPYFCTLTILEWLPVLIESRYIEPVIGSLRFCREKKGLQLFGYVVMPNHLHLIGGADILDLHEIMRDFKRFTSRAVHDLLKEDGRATLLKWLDQATEPARRARGELGLWQPGFHPQAICSEPVFAQKLRYLHENPVRKGLVRSPEEWWYSSARTYAGDDHGCLDLDSIGF